MLSNSLHKNQIEKQSIARKEEYYGENNGVPVNSKDHIYICTLGLFSSLEGAT